MERAGNKNGVQKVQDEFSCELWNCSEKGLSAAYPRFDTKVEIEQKSRREVKNEAVMRLAGEIKQREQVSIKLKAKSYKQKNSNGPLGSNDMQSSFGERLLWRERRSYLSFTRAGRQRRRRSRNSSRWRRTSNGGCS